MSCSSMGCNNRSSKRSGDTDLFCVFRQGKRRLKPTAVPTIFTFEGEKKRKEVKPPSLRLRPAASPSTQNIVKTPVAVVQGASEDLIEGTTSRGSQTSPPRTPKKQEQMSVWRDHCYFISESPKTLKRRAEAARQQLAVAHKKMKITCQQTRRMRSSLLALKTKDTALRTRLKEVEKALAAFRK
ncbi:hypothetical protein JOQ06_015353 [Pogonophryne albipinna]|uniref:Uncharacterized protein n=1 Tax=Pogonophryne albipinna TaxID=1090488 RepID=A0AAD6A9P4_9TELE|nr:hypothetical protein JOQ06_015353 [Pogonophryne albipinna]